MLDIHGKPLIQHVYECACKSTAKDVIIATDDQRIEEAVKRFDAKCCMTGREHPSGTDRLSEVVELFGIGDTEIIVNLQGDEPMMPAGLLDQVAMSLENTPDAAMSTLCEVIQTPDEVFDPDIVKVIFDQSGSALYFSRAPIPWARGAYDEQNRSRISVNNSFRHIGLYAYRAGFLRRYPQLPACQLEQQEALEQLRALYHGFRIQVEIAAEPAGVGVDTPADLDKVREMLKA